MFTGCRVDAPDQEPSSACGQCDVCDAAVQARSGPRGAQPCMLWGTELQQRFIV